MSNKVEIVRGHNIRYKVAITRNKVLTLAEMGFHPTHFSLGNAKTLLLVQRPVTLMSDHIMIQLLKC